MVTSAAANLAHQVATVRSTSTNATPTLAGMEPPASTALTGIPASASQGSRASTARPTSTNACRTPAPMGGSASTGSTDSGVNALEDIMTLDVCLT